MCYFIQSDHLLNLKKAYNDADLLLDRVQWKHGDYVNNIKFFSFGDKINSQNEFTERYEFLFMLIYTFYKRILEKNGIDTESLTDLFDIVEDTELSRSPVSIVSFSSNQYASTKQAEAFEEINHFKVLLRLICEAEKAGIDFFYLLLSLKFIKPRDKNSKNAYRLGRRLRNSVLGKIIKLKRIADEFEKLFYECFILKIKGEVIGYKHFKTLYNFFVFYERRIFFGGERHMNNQLQEMALKLGKSIGQGILRFDNPENKTNKGKENAKNGRGYIIALKKARTLQQFLDEIIRVQTRYALSVKTDLLKQISAQNFIFIKQFAVISALNQLNSVIFTEDKDEPAK